MINLSQLLRERFQNGDDDEDGEGGGHGSFAAGFIDLPPKNDFFAENAHGSAPAHPLLADQRQFSGVFGRGENGHSNLNPQVDKNDNALQNRLAHRLGNTNRLSNVLRPQR